MQSYNQALCRCRLGSSQPNSEHQDQKNSKSYAAGSSLFLPDPSSSPKYFVCILMISSRQAAEQSKGKKLCS